MSPEGGNGRGGPGGEVYFELIRQGNFVKATAVDPDSGQEASIVGPASAASADLQGLALAKLRKQLGAGSEGRRQDPRSGGGAKPRSGRGIVI